jgi:hypothetical protein
VGHENAAPAVRQKTDVEFESGLLLPMNDDGDVCRRHSFFLPAPVLGDPGAWPKRNGRTLPLIIHMFDGRLTLTVAETDLTSLLAGLDRVARRR